MLALFVFLSGTLFYMELVYHIAGFGMTVLALYLLIPSLLFAAGLESIIVSIFPQRFRRAILQLVLWLDFLFYASHLIYLNTFKQPLRINAAANAGAMAVTTYWREILYAIGQYAEQLLILAAPILIYIIYLLIAGRRRPLRAFALRWPALLYCLCPLALATLLLSTGYQYGLSFYEEYQDFYDPLTIVERYGVLGCTERELLADALPAKTVTVMNMTVCAVDEVTLVSDGSKGEQEIPTLRWEESAQEEETPVSGVEEVTEAVEEAETEEAESAQQLLEEEPLDESPNVLPIDFEALYALADNKTKQGMVAYLQERTPTKRNKYTGMFAGYNLIYLTAEGFSPYAVDEELTPTLYRLTHSGFVVNDYYVPLWQTSTSDGEYVNLTGLIPDQQFSMARSAANEQPFSLPAYFAKEGVKSYAYHNNSLSYYDRYLSHPNFGYDFKACKLGGLSASQWSSQVFEMEGSDEWPASDLNMIKATLPEYINDERFHVYYMTVSGHMNYNFKGNSMSAKHKDEVADLPYSEEGKAYIACNIELDLALEYLLEELERNGKLDNTLIVLSADHYPYAMEVSHLEELAGRELEGTLDIYRNSLIMWNSEMETVEITKTCSSLDLIPTLYNLFGFEYDSRLYSGTDMLSDSPSLVVFSDRSFITDTISYNKKKNSAEARNGEPVDETYLETVKQQVKELYEYSGNILKQNFYRDVNQSLETALVPEQQGK